MSCNFDEMLLYEFLDDVLEPAEKLVVSNHLSACPHCRKKLSEIKLMFYELEHMEAIEIPEELSLIRLEAVKVELGKSKESKSLLTQLQETKTVLLETPVVNHLVPTKEKMVKTSKFFYDGTKKIVTNMPKKEKKKTRLKGKLGGLL
ncbi:MAG: zf-HC2 domain-containing protein [Clostridia bacterium]|nr:zf-HC2 domain-containing protein [Clostridia bacterium]